jgi:hypothetical protein
MLFGSVSLLIQAGLYLYLVDWLRKEIKNKKMLKNIKVKLFY